jgi:hypothetical protein
MLNPPQDSRGASEHPIASTSSLSSSEPTTQQDYLMLCDVQVFANYANIIHYEVCLINMIPSPAKIVLSRDPSKN